LDEDKNVHFEKESKSRSQGKNVHFQNSISGTEFNKSFFQTIRYLSNSRLDKCKMYTLGVTKVAPKAKCTFSKSIT
jgi:hypothetical protein